MTTYQGSINGITSQTLQGVPGTGPSGPSNWVANGYNRSYLQAYTDYYAATGNEIAGSIIKMFPLLDPGIMILYFILTVVHSTGSLTLSLGDLDSATRYLSTSSDGATAGVYLLGSVVSSSGFYVIGTNPTTGATATDSDAQIILTTGTSTLSSSNVFGLTAVYAVT